MSALPRITWAVGVSGVLALTALGSCAANEEVTPTGSILPCFIRELPDKTGNEPAIICPETKDRDAQSVEPTKETQ